MDTTTAFTSQEGVMFLVEPGKVWTHVAAVHTSDFHDGIQLSLGCEQESEV